MENTKKSINFNLILLRIGLVIFVLLVIILALDFFKIISLGDIIKKGVQITKINKILDQKNDTEIIVKVDEENIYQKDLDFEMQNYPQIQNIDRKKILLDKLIKDSIVLQGAQTDGITKLDSSVFNSPQKNYNERISLINAVKEKINLKSDSLTGGIVSIWFYNGAPGRIGYEKGKELALATITKLYSDVKNKKLTIQQAGQAIRNDPMLGRVDPGYLHNALMEFKKNPDEKIVFDEGFNKIIRQLKTDEVSDVYLAKTKKRNKNGQTEELVDSVYMFAQVSGRNKSNFSSFDDWYNQKVKNYEITYK